MPPDSGVARGEGLQVYNPSFQGTPTGALKSSK